MDKIKSFNRGGSALIPYGRQLIDEDDISAVIEVLRSDYLTQGKKIPQFESNFCELTRSSHAVAVNSATSALHIALLALGVGVGNSVWTVPNTFVATSNAVLYCGAKVDFVDIDPISKNMSVRELRKKLENAAVTGRLPSVLIPVHFAGESCEMDKIKQLADAYGFKIIEDASHAVGGVFKGQPVGSCKFGDITIFSFHPVKIITTGEGGLATTNSDVLAERMRSLRSHGITRDAANFMHDQDGCWYYEQQLLGFNYRLTDIQAALGISQLKKLSYFLARRHEIAEMYNEQLANTPLKLQSFSSGSALHLYQVFVSPVYRKALVDHLRLQGVNVNVHYIPVHTQPYYKNLGFKLDDFPGAAHHYETAISLPIFPSMTNQQVDYVCKLIREYFS